MSHKEVDMGLPICVVCRWPIFSSSTGRGVLQTMFHIACLVLPPKGKR